MENETGVPGLSLSRQYLKYANFESKILPSEAVARAADEAEVKVDIAVSATNFKPNTYEVVIDVVANTYSQSGRQLFSVDVSYAGVFTLSDVQPEHLEMILLIYCPGVIYPFARNSVYNITTEGGFPPLMLDLVDFSKIYNEQKEKITQNELSQEAEAEAGVQQGGEGQGEQEGQ